MTSGSPKNTHLIIENNVPVLRQKDILSEKDATSPCSQIYFLIQLMYIDEANLTTHQQKYWNVVRLILEAAPKLIGHIDQINEYILGGKYYQALKLAGELIEYEQEVLKNADTDPITASI